MRTPILVLVSVATARLAIGQPGGSPNPSVPPIPNTTFNAADYRKAVLTPQAFGIPAIGAALGQWSNTPHEWGQGSEGYFKRYGSFFGNRFIKGSTNFGVAKAHNEMLFYRKSNLKGTWPRMRHAIVHTWWVQHADGTDGYTVAYGRIVGNITAAGISRAWVPDSRRTFGHFAANAATGMGFDMLTSIAREFWPWRRGRP